MSLLERNLLFLKGRKLGIARPDPRRPEKRAAEEIRISVNKLKIFLKVFALIIVYSIISDLLFIVRAPAEPNKHRREKFGDARILFIREIECMLFVRFYDVSGFE